MRTIVFVNTYSRQATQHLKLVQRYFKKPNCPFEIVDFIMVDEAHPFDACVKRLQATKNFDYVIIGSGDGTIVSVFNALKGRKNITYGFIPLGTSNNYVRSLGIPTDIRRSLRTLKKLHTQPISLGTVNGTIFANNAGIGLPAQVADTLTNKTKRYLGPLAYVVSGIHQLFHHDAIWCELEIHGKIQAFDTHHLSISSGSYKGTIMPMNKVTSAFSDELTIVYSATKERLEYVKDLLGFIYGRSVKRESTHVITIKEAKLRTNPVQTIQADGEIIGKTPVTISVIKDAIRVLTPPPKPTRQMLGTRRKSRRQNR